MILAPAAAATCDVPDRAGAGSRLMKSEKEPGADCGWVRVVAKQTVATPAKEGVVWRYQRERRTNSRDRLKCQGLSVDSGT